MSRIASLAVIEGGIVHCLPPGDPVRFSDHPPDPSETSRTGLAPWVILVVDDDQDVHDATVLALAGETILGRPVALRHAHDGAGAWRILCAERGIHAVLLDVVMETPDAGLKLVDAIRNDLDRPDLKIIIRTGQPGLAPDAEVRGHHAIDGYITKSQQTRALLLDALGRALAAPATR